MTRKISRNVYSHILWTCTVSVICSTHAWAQTDSSTPGALIAPKLSLDPPPPDTDLTALSLEQLMKVEVTTLSRVAEPIDQAPGSIYLFDHEKITNRGYHSLGDLLQIVPGFTVLQKDLTTVAGVRGLNANDNEKMSLLINGQNVNGVNEPDFLNGPINLDTAKRVEVVVGPSSLFQQANTLAATVNLITRDVEGFEVDQGFGNQLNYSTTVMAGHQFSPEHNFTLSLTTEDIRGYNAFDKGFRPNVAGRHEVGELDQPNYFAVAKGQMGELFGQFIAYRTSSPELSINNGSPANNGVNTDEFYTGYLRLEHPLTSTLMAVISGDVAYKQQSRLNKDGLPVNALQQYLDQLDFNTDWSLQYAGIAHNNIQLGVQATYENNMNDWYTLNSPDLTVPQTTLFNKNTYALGGYLDDEYAFSDKIKFVGGMRIDRNTRLAPDRWYPGFRAGIITQPTKDWTSKLTFNRAVRMPSAIAALNTAWGINNPSAPEWARLAPPAAQPEILSTLEWQNIVYIKKNRLSLTAYHQELTNFISWFGPHTNIGNFSGNGIELSIDAPVTSKLDLWANGSYNISKLTPFTQYSEPNGDIEQHHVLTNPSGQIVGAPKVTANCGLEYTIVPNLILAPSIRYFTEQAGFQNDGDRFVTIRNRIYLDAALTWRNAIGKNLDLHLSVQNLLNNRQQVAGQWLRDTYAPRGTSVIFSAEMRF